MKMKNSTTDVESVKRKLFSRFAAKEEYAPDKRDIKPSPLKSIAENLKMSAFVEKIDADKLVINTKYPSNYVSLRVVSILHNNTNGINGTEKDCEIQSLQLLGQEASCKTISDDKIVCVSLHDAYASCPSLAVGKILQVAKFVTSECSQKSYRVHDCDIQALPYKLIVKPSQECMPFVTVNNEHLEPETSNSVLSVCSLVTPKQTIIEPLRFTSYVKPKVASENGDSRRSSITSANGDSNGNGNGLGDDHSAKQSCSKRAAPVSPMQTRTRTPSKRICRSTSDIAVETPSPMKRSPSQRRACSSSHV